MLRYYKVLEDEPVHCGQRGVKGPIFICNSEVFEMEEHTFHGRFSSRSVIKGRLNETVSPSDRTFSMFVQSDGCVEWIQGNVGWLTVVGSRVIECMTRHVKGHFWANNSLKSFVSNGI
ncbi:hypothetical protein ANTRET_LOCUS5006 [Anthophora retusa]